MIKYLKEIFVELNNVTWPTRQRGIKVTTIVFIFMIVSAAVLGVIDYAFSLGLKSLIGLDSTTFTPSDVAPDITPADVSTDVTPIEVAPTDLSEIAPIDSAPVEITPADPEVNAVETPVSTIESNEPNQEGLPEITPSETNPS